MASIGCGQETLDALVLQLMKWKENYMCNGERHFVWSTQFTTLDVELLGFHYTPTNVTLFLSNYAIHIGSH